MSAINVIAGPNLEVLMFSIRVWLVCKCTFVFSLSSFLWADDTFNEKTLNKNVIEKKVWADSKKGQQLALRVDEEVHIWGKARQADDVGYVSPTSVLTQQDMSAINRATTEDLVKFEPSLVIRRRFIGDSNGTMGVRGSNMFQTSRSMVFADGVPLHYFLQSRWNGAPRWTMVSASEIAQVEVLYGPFSAQYSGNSMGGVVLIETAIPQEREFHLDGSYFNQNFNAYSFNDNVDGFKGFVSYGDKVGNTSFYISYNHLDNTAQPQTFRDTAFDSSELNDTVNGRILDRNSLGVEKIWFGDTGVVETSTDNIKFKVGYDAGAWQSLFNLAYENRDSSNVGQSYITDLNGDTLWSGENLIQNSQVFSFDSSRLNANELNRQSLSLGFRLKGQVSDNVRLEANVNRFDILKDESVSSRLNPNDGNYTLDGEIDNYDNSGWHTAELKFIFEGMFISNIDLVSGLRYERYALHLNVYDSPDYTSFVKGDYKSRSGGETQILAAYTQANWIISSQWDATFGLRYESFESRRGYYSADNIDTALFDIVTIPSESRDAVSPKFSVAYRPKESWLLRYSAAKAYRFPIVEELFSQYESYNTVSIASPELKAEAGIHHNIMLDKMFDDGYVRLNIFHESVSNAIESQTDTTTNPSVRTFVPIDAVDVSGIEFIANKKGVIDDVLDVRFNITWSDAKIVDNRSAESGENFDVTASIEGNVYPRMPTWRSNLLATLHLHDAWELSMNAQYASDSFGRLDNTDTQDNVYGAQDAYLRFGVKTTFQIDKHYRASIGVDNISNDVAYVAHPWPGRTIYMNLSFDM